MLGIQGPQLVLNVGQALISFPELLEAHENEDHVEVGDPTVPLVGNLIDVDWPAMLLFSSLKSIVTRGAVAPECCPSVPALRHRSQLSRELCPPALREQIPSEASNCEHSDGSRTTKRKLLLLL